MKNIEKIKEVLGQLTQVEKKKFIEVIDCLTIAYVENLSKQPEYLDVELKALVGFKALKSLLN